MYEIISSILGTLMFLCLCYCGWAQYVHRQKKVNMQIAFEQGRISKEEYDVFLRSHRFLDTLRDPKYVLRTITRLPNT